MTQSPRAVNDMSHDAPRAPNIFATSGRMTRLRQQCDETVAMRHVVADFYHSPTSAGNSIRNALLGYVAPAVVWFKRGNDFMEA